MCRYFALVINHPHEDEMLGLTQKELALLGKYETPITLLLFSTENKGSRWWAMHVRSATSPETREIQTALGKRKVWRELSSVERFIEEVFPDREVRISIEIGIGKQMKSE